MATVSKAGSSHRPKPPPKAIIVPHAGYVYSGPIAASAYARLKAAREDIITRVVLLGPSHRVGFRGIAVSGMAAFATPLGQIPVDRAKRWSKRGNCPMSVSSGAGSRSGTQPGGASAVPARGAGRVQAGAAGGRRCLGHRRSALVLEALWGGPETLIVISSDLSHYQDYQTAQRMDRETSRAIEALRFEDIGYEQACGRNPVNGLLWVARRKNAARWKPSICAIPGIPPGRATKSWDTAPMSATESALPPGSRHAARRRPGASIQHGLRQGQALDGEPGTTTPKPCESPRATFVTLEIGGQLRGCIGALAGPINRWCRMWPRTLMRPPSKIRVFPHCGRRSFRVWIFTSRYCRHRNRCISDRRKSYWRNCGQASMV
jgi:hypothetical protein